jgi:hypothetical protein
MKVEQYASEGSGKTFCLLLHYPPSSPLHARCYPALFLGGWDHIFLDSIGDSSGLDMNTHVSLVCRNVAATLSECEKFMHQLRTLILPRVLPHLLSQNLFYRDQKHFQRNSFLERKVCLSRLLATKIDTATVEHILCEKFVHLWFNHVMLRATFLASNSLSQGLTQLSLAMSIHSTLVRVFQLFLSDALVQANQWRNLDIIAVAHRRSPRDSCVLKLFEMILPKLPVLPIEELVLQRRNVSINRLIPQPVNRLDSDDNKFPFFQLISSFLDELVESIGISIRHESSHTESFSYSTCAFEILERAMDKLLQQNGSKEQNCERRRLVHSVIMYVREQSCNQNEASNSLFLLYLRQYNEWKLGCATNSFFLQWWTTRIKSFVERGENNIVAIHVIGWVEELDMMKISSIIALTDSFLQDLKIDQDETAVTACDVCDTLLGNAEQALMQHQFNPKQIRWSILLSTASDSIKCDSNEMQHERLATRLRRLGLAFVQSRVTVNKTDSSYAPSYPNDGTAEQTNVSLKKFVDLATHVGDNNVVEVLLEYFLSPVWLDISLFFVQDDLNFLFDAIENNSISHASAVGLLRGASRDSSNKHFVPNCSMNVLLLLSQRLTADDIAQFTEEGKRCCLQIFVPKWLRVETSEIQATVESHLPARFCEYRNPEHDELASVVFEFFLSLFVTEAVSISSEEVFLSLEQSLNTEFMLKRHEYTKLARLRKFGPSDALEGTLVSAIAISARLVCFVAKVAFEIAIDMNAFVLNGPYANEASRLLEELMGVGNVAKWQEFFMSTILRVRGDGTLTKAIMDGGPLSKLLFCRSWIDGIQASKDGVCEALSEAERSLASAVDEERWKSQNFRLCPHCRRTFVVAALNCGQFICGRDAHNVNGQAYMDGIAISDVPGAI